MARLRQQQKIDDPEDLVAQAGLGQASEEQVPAADIVAADARTDAEKIRDLSGYIELQNANVERLKQELAAFQGMTPFTSSDGQAPSDIVAAECASEIKTGLIVAPDSREHKLLKELTDLLDAHPTKNKYIADKVEEAREVLRKIEG